MSGNAAGHSVIALVALRHPPENSYGVRDGGRVEVQVFRRDITECSGSKGGGTHGETFRTNSVDDGALCGAKPSLVCRADAACVSGLRKCLALNSLALRLVAVECHRSS